MGKFSIYFLIIKQKNVKFISLFFFLILFYPKIKLLVKKEATQNEQPTEVVLSILLLLSLFVSYLSCKI